MLGIIVALWNDFNFWCHEERRVEPDTKLANQVEISFLDIFNILLRASVGNRSQVTDQLILRHTNSIIDDFYNFSVFIVLNFDLEFGLVS